MNTKFIHLSLLILSFASIRASNVDERNGYDRYKAFTEEFQRKAQFSAKQKAKLDTFHAIHTQSPELFPYPELRKFIVETNNPEIQADLKKDESFLRNIFNIRSTYQKNTEIDRIDNARRAQQLIDRHNLSSLAMAKKCLVRNKQQFNTRKKAWGYHYTWTVVAQIVNGPHLNQIPQLSLQEVKDLTTFVTKTGYQDFCACNKNVIKDNKIGKLTFIDTKDNSFFNGHNEKPTQLDLINNFRKHCQSKFTDEAKTWLNDHIEDLKKTGDADRIVPFITHNTQCNDPGFDIRKAKKEYDELEV